MIIGITGSFCAGKDTAGEYIQKKKGFEHISLSNLIREELRAKDIEVTRDNLVEYANEKRASEGHSYFADKALAKIEQGKNYIITSIRHPDEVKALQKNKDFFMVFVDAPLKTRFDRMQARTERNESDPTTLKAFKAIEARENAKGGPGQQLGACKRLAKIVVRNDQDQEALFKKVDQLVKDLFVQIVINNRPSKEEYYLKIAEQVAARANCLSMKSGAIIVKEDQIISTGYNGAPRKTKDSIERGSCLRREMNIPSGTRYELCRSVHGEQNAIINAARSGVSLLGGDMYLCLTRIWEGTNSFVDSFPCFICKKMILNAGIKRLIARTADGGIKTFNVEDDWVAAWQKRDMIDDMDVYGVSYK